ncbi:MAG: flagellar hook-length control protein FliK [Gammaproteobacteria bacterium]|nr:flagellar hook-length control protein FliK [Gammaproteobacteria bacterium]
MIPASVTPSVSASASSAGALFPLMEPTSAELAEFDQLLGNFNQGSSITALSTPALTVSNGVSLAPLNQAKTNTTPEGLLVTLEQGAQLALQTPQIPMVIPDNQPLTDEQTMPVLNQGSNNITSQVQFEAVSDPLASSPIEKTSPSLQGNGTLITDNPSVMVNNQQAFSSVAPMPTNSNTGLTTTSNGSETETLNVNLRSVPDSQLQVLTSGHLQAVETKLSTPNQYAAASAVVTTSMPTTATENSMVSQLTEGADSPTSARLLGDNKSVVFASASSISVASNGVMQAASSGVETPSTSQVVNSLTSASAIIANPAGSSSGSTQQEQRQESSQSDHLISLQEEAPSTGDIELGADQFSLVSTTPLSQTTSSPILSAPLNLRQPQWAQDVAQRVQIMINQSMNELDVRLDPLGLGPMKIGLKLDEQQKAHVTLSAQHGVTRDMLENALPRLKEMLAQEGVELASAMVNSGESQTGSGQGGGQSFQQSASDLAEDAVNQAVSMKLVASNEHLVDQFA